MASPQPLFRPEAVAHHIRGEERADILAVDAAATAWGYRLIVAALVACVAFTALGRISEYASGPAVVRLDGRMMLSANQPAQVARVLVMPGDTVREGDALLQFSAVDEAAEFAAAAREFDDQLRKLLQTPDDLNAREALVSLRTRRDLAEKRLAQRSLRAPRAGLVGDVRVHAGQQVEAGASLVEIVDQSSAGHVTALLPGRYRPYLAPGKQLRFELDGFARRSQLLTIAHVGEQIIGPGEAGRYLGRDVADALSVSGPVVLVEAGLPRTSFEADGQKFAYAHGMLGKAESPVRSERIAFVFIPALKLWMERFQPTRWLAVSRGLVGDAGVWYERARLEQQRLFGQLRQLLWLRERSGH
jgi:membrane fusion protein (multidrug efflux system)